MPKPPLNVKGCAFSGPCRCHFLNTTNACSACHLNASSTTSNRDSQLYRCSTGQQADKLVGTVARWIRNVRSVPVSNDRRVPLTKGVFSSFQSASSLPSFSFGLRSLRTPPRPIHTINNRARYLGVPPTPPPDSSRRRCRLSPSPSRRKHPKQTTSTAITKLPFSHSHNVIYRHAMYQSVTTALAYPEEDQQIYQQHPTLSLYDISKLKEAGCD